MYGLWTIYTIKRKGERMSSYYTTKRHSNSKYCCKYCEYFTFEKTDIQKHLCEDKKDMIEDDKKRKGVTK